MTQAEFSTVSRVGRSRIADIERGTMNVTLTTVSTLVAALGANEAEFFALVASIDPSAEKNYRWSSDGLGSSRYFGMRPGKVYRGGRKKRSCRSQ